MTRVSDTQLLALDAALTPARRQLVLAVARLRLASGRQLQRLVYEGTSPSTARLARLDLANLFEQGCLHRLDRRIGGVRSGSAGYVYALGSVGRRLIDLWEGEGIAPPRSRYEPSVGFVDHALAVTETIVGLHERSTAQPGASVEYSVEPASWRDYLGPGGARYRLKPDAEITIHRGDFTDHWWLEVDRATERRNVIARKLATYGSYYATGAEQREREVFPLTVWLTTTEARADVLRDEIQRQPRDHRGLFRVGLLSGANEILLSDGGKA